MKTALELIAEERREQIEKHGYKPEDDLGYHKGELAQAAAAYALSHEWSLEEVKAGRSFVTKVNLCREMVWPFGAEHWKPSPNNRIKELVKAAALLIAQIEALQTLEGQS